MAEKKKKSTHIKGTTEIPPKSKLGKSIRSKTIKKRNTASAASRAALAKKKTAKASGKKVKAAAYGVVAANRGGRATSLNSRMRTADQKRGDTAYKKAKKK